MFDSGAPAALSKQTTILIGTCESLFSLSSWLALYLPLGVYRDIQPWLIAYIFGHPCYVHLTHLKSRNPLTSITWLYHGLKFKKVDHWPSAGIWFDRRLKPDELVVIRIRMDYKHIYCISLLSTQVTFISSLMSLNSREMGGVEAERKEREKWITREQQKIMDSVNGKLYRPLQKRERSGKEHGCFLFVWKN